MDKMSTMLFVNAGMVEKSCPLLPLLSSLNKEYGMIMTLPPPLKFLIMGILSVVGLSVLPLVATRQY